MAATKTTIYRHLRHPEIDTPILAAEWVGYWREAGRAIGLVLRFPGEDFDRRLEYEEIAELEADEEPCGASTDS